MLSKQDRGNGLGLSVSSEFATFYMLKIDYASNVRVVYKSAVGCLGLRPRRIAVVLDASEGGLAVRL